MQTAKWKSSSSSVHHGLISLLSLNFLCGCATGLLQLVIPLYALSLKTNMMQLGMISGAGGVGRMLIIVPSGLLVDRFGARRLFLLSTACSIFLVEIMRIITSPWTLMVVMFFQGMAQSVCFLALQAGFLKRLPYLDPTRAGWQRGATQLGYYLVGPLVGGFLLQGRLFGVAFLVAGGAFAISLAIVLYRLLVGIAEVTDTSVSRLGELGKLRSLLVDPVLLQVLGIECLGAAIFTIFRTFLAPVAIDVLHLSVNAVTGLFICQGTAAMASLFAAGRLLRRFKVREVFNGAALLVIGGMIMLASARGFFPYLFGSFIYGIGTGLLCVCSLSRIVDVKGEKGTVAALFSLSIAVGSTVGPVAGGFLGELLNVQTVFLAPAALLTGLLLAFCYRDYRWRKESRIEATGG